MPEEDRQTEDRQQAPESQEKRVSWGELFFDLVFVFAITQVSGLLHSDHSWGGLIRAVVLFVPIYWTWVGTCFHANSHDVSTGRARLGIFAIGLTGLFMAVAIPQAYGARGFIFGTAYLAARIVLAWLLFGASRISLNPFSIGLFVTGPLLFVGGLLPGIWRELVWGVAALVDLSTPTLLQRRLRSAHFDSGHLAERFGLFVLIALGESVVAIGAPVARAPGSLHPATASAVAAAFVFTCALWWVYFHFAADAMRYALTTAQVQLDITRHVLTYGHLALIGSVIGVAVGLQEAVARPGAPLGWKITALLYGGTALYLATYGYTRWKMFRLVSTTRLTAAAAVLVLLPLSTVLPSLAALIVLALALSALNVFEYARVSQIGWRAALSRRGSRSAA